MARVTTVAKARKSPGNCRKCGKVIKAGESYKWFANRIGRMSMRKNYCASCPIRQSDMTTSDKLATLYGAQEALEDELGTCTTVEDVAQALRTCAEESRNVAEEYRDSVGNMPDNLQQSSQADEMNEKADNIDSWCDELESKADELEGNDPEDDEECENCGHSYKEHQDKEEEDGKDDKKDGEDEERKDDEAEQDPVCDDFQRPTENAVSEASDVCGNLSL